MSVAITKAGNSLVLTDSNSGTIKYLPNPVLDFKPSTGTGTFDVIIFRSGPQLEAVNVALISTIDGAPKANTNAQILAQIAVLQSSSVGNVAPLLPTGSATEAKQDEGNLYLSKTLDRIGNINDAAAISDTGSFTIIAFIKRALTNWTSLLAKLPTLGQKVMSGSMAVVIASDQSALPIAPGVSSLTHTAATITTGGTAQVALAAQPTRKYLYIQNISDTDMFIRLDGVDPTAATGMLLAAGGGRWESPAHFCPVGAVNILCATTGKAFIVVTN